MRRARRAQPRDLSGEVVEHEVDYNPADRYENPHRPDPAGEAAVAREFSLERAPDDDGDKGDDQGRKDDVGDEYGEIKRACPVVERVGHRAYLEVIYQVGGEEKARANQGGQHGLAVGFAFAAADLEITSQK